MTADRLGEESRTPNERIDACPSVVALGMFDGVHIGHQALVRQAVEIARNHGWQSVVYTFENHPRSVYATMPPLLTDAATRKSELLALGVDRVDMVFFTKEMADSAPWDFIRMLTKRYNLKAVVVGRDFSYGKQGAGDVALFRKAGAELGFSVYVTPDVLLDGEKVSSSRIRRALQSGNQALAKRMLARERLSE